MCKRKLQMRLKEQEQLLYLNESLTCRFCLLRPHIGGIPTFYCSAVLNILTDNQD